MQSFPINYLALLVAALVRMAMGALWYSPALFVNQWLALVNQTPEDMKAGMGKNIVTDLIGSFIMAFVLVHAVHYAGATTIGQGVAVGFFNWLGFIATVTLSTVNYEKRPTMLWVINNGYQLITLAIMGAIVAVWR
jgi:hypothetical protein